MKNNVLGVLKELSEEDFWKKSIIVIRFYIVWAITAPPPGWKCSLIPFYMYMYSMYIYIYPLYGIQDPGPCIHVTVYTDPYPVPHETTNTVYH